MKIVGLAYNYKGYEEKPIWFLKGNRTRDGSVIKVPVDLHTWAEPELGFVMGPNGIRGFVLANDITTQVLDRDCHLPMSKARDTYCPIIPIEGTIDPTNVTLKAFINGREVVSGHTASRILIENGALGFLEYFIRLFSGDIVLTGCPLHTKEPIVPKDTVVCEAWQSDRLLARLENKVSAL